MKFFIILAVALVIVAWGAKSCVPHRLDEKIFYVGNGLELKVITYFENLPLHFTGNIYRVLCKSEKTQEFSATKYNDAGYQSYLPLYTGLIELGFKPTDNMDINKLAETAKQGYIVPDKETVIVDSGSEFFVSWDGCASFVHWSFANLPESDLVETTPEFVACVEQYEKQTEWPHIIQEIKKHGSISKACQSSKFLGANKPTFFNHRASLHGTASVSITSSALKKQEPLKIETTDFGKSWKTY